jgi:WD40 repeat protein
MCFTPDGKRLAVGDAATDDAKGIVPVIGIWDLDRESRPLVIRDPGFQLYSLAFASDGKTLISGGNSGSWPNAEPKIKVWDAKTGKTLREFGMHDLKGLCVFTVSRDGRKLVSIHPDRLIVWDLASEKIVRTIPLERWEPGIQGGGSLDVSPDGRTIAAARDDHTVHLWDLNTGKSLFPQAGAHEAIVTSTAIAPDGRLVATGDSRGTILLWDAARGEYVRRVELGVRDVVHSLRFSHDGRSLAAASRFLDSNDFKFRGIVRLWEMPGGTMQKEFRIDAEPLRLAYSPDSRQIAVALRDHPNNPPGRARPIGQNDEIQVFDIATGQKHSAIGGRQGPTYALAFSADGKSIAAVDADEAFADMTFWQWDLSTGRAVKKIPIEGHRQGPNSPHPGEASRLCAAVFAPDLSVAATGAMLDDQILVWDLVTGRVQRTIQVETYAMAALAISSDGRLLAAASSPLGGKGSDTTIRVWEIATKREVLRLEPKSSAVRSLAFSRDGKTLVSGMADTTVMIWDCSAADQDPSKPRD